MIMRLADIPLRQQPGTMWHYSVAVDVQGYLVEVLSGQKLDQFLDTRLFKPLGMVDTGFYVPERRSTDLRRSTPMGRMARSSLRRSSMPAASLEAPSSPRKMLWTCIWSLRRFCREEAGLVSTTADYMRFSQMLLNGGELDGVRILSPLTVDLMRRNQLPRDVKEMQPGIGFGLDFAVIDDPVAADGISRGEYYWGGAAGTWFWIDPAED